MITQLFTVGLGGFIGSVLRHLVNLSLRSPAPGFPWSTLTVNAAGSLGIGLVLGLAEKQTFANPAVVLFLTTGILGGFTTFSAFSFETFTLLRTGNAGIAALNIAGSLVLGIGCAALGFKLAS